MASPPPAEGSSRETGGDFRGRAGGLHYNPVDDEDIWSSAVIGAVKGSVLLYTSSLDPAQLQMANLKPSMRASVKVNTNLGPVLRQLAALFEPIMSKLS